MELTKAAADVLAERQRQIEVEGWSAARDDGYEDCELGRAAAVYVLAASMRDPTARLVVDSHGAGAVSSTIKRFWPWSDFWFKPKNRRADLVKAGALILAEIERLDRKEKNHVAN